MLVMTQNRSVWPAHTGSWHATLLWCTWWSIDMYSGIPKYPSSDHINTYFINKHTQALLNIKISTEACEENLTWERYWQEVRKSDKYIPYTY